MAELFQRDKSTISRHIKNIFEDGELDKNSVVAKNATTASDNKIYQIDYYNLDVIISVGYSVKSKRGVQFRIWAMSILKEYLKIGIMLKLYCLAIAFAISSMLGGSIIPSNSFRFAK